MTNQIFETSKKTILEGRATLGIELGSTRIKAVLIGEDHSPIASGGYEWETQLVDGVWTYSLDDVWRGLQDCYHELADDVQNQYGVPLTKFKAIGISAMMHGYLIFDKAGDLLVPFRTWRNTMTEQAAMQLSELFQFNIPQRWSVAHLYQAILRQEPHVKDISYITTLAGYVQWKLTGKKVVGIGDASGMFPIDSTAGNYDARIAGQFNTLLKDAGMPYTQQDIFPEILLAGADAGVLTEQGAKLLDSSGMLQSGIPLCPPEGDAATGMVATNSVTERTGNISAGTSIFAMIVLEEALPRMYAEIDMITTPTGKPVAMVHCNNFTPDLDAWVRLFQEAAEAFGLAISKNDCYTALYEKAMVGEPDGGGLFACNYYAGEHITKLEQGRPLVARMPDSRLTLANFMRTMIFSAMGTLRIGMNILTEKEQVSLDNLLGHGGFFKTKDVGQTLMAAALNTPVSVMESAGEGGAWGIALLAAYAAKKQADETLEAYLADHVFQGAEGTVIPPNQKDVEGFNRFMERYEAGLHVERAAAEYLK